MTRDNNIPRRSSPILVNNPILVSNNIQVNSLIRDNSNIPEAPAPSSRILPGGLPKWITCRVKSPFSPVA